MKAPQLTLLIGRGVALPAPASLMAALRSVEVNRTDQGPSGFQLQLELRRSGGASEYDLMQAGLLQPFNRVVLMVTLDLLPHVIMDGLITHHQLMPGSNGQPDSIAITGQDISVAMDLVEKSMAYPAMNDSAVVELIVAEYLEYGMIPMVIPTEVSISDTPEECTTQQTGTDRAFINCLAERHGYVFQVYPGPAPMTNVAYFGPPQRVGMPHKTLTINLPPGNNVDSIQFSHDAMKATLMRGSVQDTLESDADVPVQTFASLRLPPLATEQPVQNLPWVRVGMLDATGLDPVEAWARAQALTDRSTDDVLTAQGQLDVMTYGDLLGTPGLVGVRGAGQAHDGMYYVSSVTHTITPDSYKQQFTLTREGFGTTVPRVLP